MAFEAVEAAVPAARVAVTSFGRAPLLVLDHAGVPEDRQDAVASGWQARYWEPLAKHLA